MKDILKSNFLKEFSNIIDKMYQLGWDERNGGNVSWILNEDEVRKYLNVNKVIRTFKIDIDVLELAGKMILITGSGKYFRNLKSDPESNCGIIKIDMDGKSASLLWGLRDGGKPTSELNAHLKSHIARLKIDDNHRVTIHTHATNLIALTFIQELNEKEITKILWQMCTECIIVFPEGVGIIPWMVPGNAQIGIATAEKLNEYRMVIWPMHGVIGCGRTIDEVFGLIETAEKAAEIYLKIAGLPIKQYISEQQLQELSEAFGVKPKMDFLK